VFFCFFKNTREKEKKKKKQGENFENISKFSLIS